MRANVHFILKDHTVLCVILAQICKCSILCLKFNANYIILEISIFVYLKFVSPQVFTIN